MMSAIGKRFWAWMKEQNKPEAPRITALVILVDGQSDGGGLVIRESRHQNLDHQHPAGFASFTSVY